MKVLIAGDFCLGRFWAKEAVYREEVLNETAAKIAEITAKHDISMVNVETVYSDCDTEIYKAGSRLKSPIWTLDFLKRMGFQVAACANNHIGDFGEKGVLDTLAHLRSIGMVTVGAGRNAQEAAEIRYLEKGGITLALVNCCEHEFGFARRDKAGSAAVDWYGTGKQIKEASCKAGAVIVYLHGGNEHNPLPRPGMKKLCHYFAECGASAVVVCHSHCPQGMEVYQGVPIAYGIGNFFFPETNNIGMWHRGFLVSMDINKGKKAVMEIIPYIQNQEPGQIRFLEQQELTAFRKYMDYISDLMNQDKVYEKLTLAWCSRIAHEWAAECLKIATENGQDEETLIVRNLHTCESHNELITTYFEALCDGRIEDSLERYSEMIRELQQGRIPE